MPDVKNAYDNDEVLDLGGVHPVTPEYLPVDLRDTPDFSQARITGVVLSMGDERKMRATVGKVIEAGNNLLGYSRQELQNLCGIQSAQFSKIIKGEAWMNIGNQGLWGFATGMSPKDVVQLAPLKADPPTCITYYLNGHLHALDHDEFELVSKLICRRFGVGYMPVDIMGIEPVAKLQSETWRTYYLKDLMGIVAQRLLELRQCLDLSQKAFADIMGVTVDTVKHYESCDGRLNGGVFATYRLYATFNVNPIEITVGSIHHKIRYVYEQRHKTLQRIVKKIDYHRYCDLKAFALSVKKL